MLTCRQRKLSFSLVCAFISFLWRLSVHCVMRLFPAVAEVAKIRFLFMLLSGLSTYLHVHRQLLSLYVEEKQRWSALLCLTHTLPRLGSCLSHLQFWMKPGLRKRYGYFRRMVREFPHVNDFPVVSLSAASTSHRRQTTALRWPVSVVKTVTCTLYYLIDGGGLYETSDWQDRQCQKTARQAFWPCVHAVTCPK